MNLMTNEKIRIIAGRRNLTMADLAEAMGTSRQNLANKMTKNNFTESELKEIAAALGCEYDAVFTMKDSGEQL